MTKPGLPESAPRADSQRFEKIAKGESPSKSWKTQEWLEYLQTLPKPVSDAKMAELDAQWNLSNAGNYEILAEWLGLAIQTGYEPAFPRLNLFLHEVGRTRMLRHLYSALNKTAAGRERALAIYATARAGYHPMAQTVVDRLLY